MAAEPAVLALNRFSHLGALSAANTFLALGAVLCFGANVVCFVLNLYELEPAGCGAARSAQECQKHAPVASVQLFHDLEFTAAFVFAVIQMLSILYSPKRQFMSPLLFKALSFWNMAATFIAAALVFINKDEFEFPAHQLEYANGVCFALFDVLMTIQLVRDHENLTTSNRLLYAVLAVVPTCVAASLLAVYNLMGTTEDGALIGERPAHFLEFSFEMISSSVSFCFCMDNKLRCDKMRAELMLGPSSDKSDNV